MDKLIDALCQVEGAYSLVALTSKKLIGVRDPNGVRPLVLGMLDGAPHLRVAKPARWTSSAPSLCATSSRARWWWSTRTGSKAIFPSSRSSIASASSNISISRGRIPRWKGAMSMRRASASARCWPQESRVDADMVIPVPDSGVPAALGYAECRQAFRSSWASSATIMSAAPSSSRPTRIRHLGVRLKHNPNRAMLKGKRVMLVDDSIVRGTTSKKIVEMVRDAGAAEVHFRVSSPPTTHSCFYGVDTPNTDDLLAHKMDVEQMRRFIGADSLAFISMDGLYRAMGKAERDGGQARLSAMPVSPATIPSP